MAVIAIFLLTGNPITGALLRPPQLTWSAAITFSGVIIAACGTSAVLIPNLQIGRYARGCRNDDCGSLDGSETARDSATLSARANLIDLTDAVTLESRCLSLHPGRKTKIDSSIYIFSPHYIRFVYVSQAFN